MVLMRSIFQLKDWATACRRLCRLLVNLRQDCAGVVSIELALVTVFLATVAMGTFDFARYGIETVRVTQATRAGLQFALQDEANATDKVAIEQAVRTDANDTKGQLSVTVGTPFCACPGHVATACNATCADGGYALRYIDLTVQSSIDMLFSYPGISSSIPISSTSQLRLN